ncbi:mitochondrial ribosomal protein L28 [Lycorma delicatula]|uniref:mitochondrial ribosomal protein L28 n=1 Tax=Lycorma delicatula TaxID=130591 RepID=UPI003F50F6A5
MAATELLKANRLYRFKKLDILDDNLRCKLPEAYKKFYREWRLTVPSPVNYIPRSEKWERNPETGVVSPVQNIPILPKYPDESHKGLWGGEGVVDGLIQKNKKYYPKTPHFWFPQLKRSVIYSEILNRFMSTIVTNRTINLILDNNGLDHYLLKSKACDIQSELGVKLKRKMLLALYNKDLYNDDPVKKEQVYNKYKDYLVDYSKEDIEWYGLNMYEALMKLENDAEAVSPQPMKHLFRKQLIDQLKQELIDEMTTSATLKAETSKRSWLSKINPFSSSQESPKTK